MPQINGMEFICTLIYFMMFILSLTIVKQMLLSSYVKLYRSSPPKVKMFVIKLKEIFNGKGYL